MKSIRTFIPVLAAVALTGFGSLACAQLAPVSPTAHHELAGVENSDAMVITRSSFLDHTVITVPRSEVNDALGSHAIEATSQIFPATSVDNVRFLNLEPSGAGRTEPLTMR